MIVLIWLNGLLVIISFCNFMFARTMVSELRTRQEKEAQEWENAVLAMKHKRKLIRDPKEYE